MNKKEDELSFEKAYLQLEQILEKLNSSSASLDESLKLYEEADRLITFCNQKLHDAEKKIEILTKNREGNLALDSNGKPITEPFSLERGHALAAKKEDSCPSHF